MLKQSGMACGSPQAMNGFGSSPGDASGVGLFYLTANECINPVVAIFSML